MNFANVTELKAGHAFCGHCGRPMTMLDLSTIVYDRTTGAKIRTGPAWWQCPEHDDEHDEDNEEHDCVMLGQEHLQGETVAA